MLWDHTLLQVVTAVQSAGYGGVGVEENVRSSWEGKTVGKDEVYRGEK